MSTNAFEIVTAIFVITVWVVPNERSCALVHTWPDLIPWWAAIGMIGNSVVLTVAMARRNWIMAFACAVAVTMCARILWHWWRRRRQGKPSRVLGMVTDLGHKLTVVNVPAEEGNR